MSVRERRREQARLRGVATLVRFGREIRDARLAGGLSQRSVAAEAGISGSTWSRVEAGEVPSLALVRAVRMAASVGLDLSLKLFVSDRAVRDRGHLRLLRDLRRLLGPMWQWRYEVPVGRAPDQRAWDAVAVHRVTGLTIRVEAETRLGDAQAVLRKVELKRAADPQGRVLLVLRDSVHNRAAVGAASQVLRTTFPVGARAALARLRAGEDPGGDVLLLVDWLTDGQRTGGTAVGPGQGASGAV